MAVITTRKLNKIIYPTLYDTTNIQTSAITILPFPKFDPNFDPKNAMENALNKKDALYIVRLSSDLTLYMVGSDGFEPP